MLLERPGEVITRDEMQARLWPAETFVDFDHGLNSAIRRLRDALGDTAENPTFVETLGGRGYRFVFPVEGHNGDDSGKGNINPGLAGVVPISASEPPTRARPTPCPCRQTSLAVSMIGFRTDLVYLSLERNNPGGLVEYLGVRRLAATASG
jgi:hypothetical protein